MLLVKSTNHFHAGFEPIAAEIIYVSAPSSYPSNPAVTNYTKLTRPVWPRVADPWKGAAGKAADLPLVGEMPVGQRGARRIANPSSPYERAIASRSAQIAIN